MSKRWRFFLGVVVCCLFWALVFSPAAGSLEEEWVGKSVSARPQGVLADWALKGIKWFQEVISPIDAGRCQMYPTCSEYSRQAIAKHGLVMGLVMTFDRLLHEYDEPRFAPTVVVGGRVRYHDPVSANDFWW